MPAVIKVISILNKIRHSIKPSLLKTGAFALIFVLIGIVFSKTVLVKSQKVIKRNPVKPKVEVKGVSAIISKTATPSATITASPTPTKQVTAPVIPTNTPPPSDQYASTHCHSYSHFHSYSYANPSCHGDSDRNPNTHHDSHT